MWLVMVVMSLQQYVIVCNLDRLGKKEIICIQCHLSTI